MPWNAITHSGRAHLDEILAISVISAYKRELPAEIRRIGSDEAAAMASSGDLPEDTWMVDCGLIHNPERRVFDHHQDRALPSAALMVFHHFYPELEGTGLEGYFELVSRVDTGSMRALADFASLGESRDYFGSTQQIITGAFEADPLSAVDVMSRGLAGRILFEEEKKAAAEWVGIPGRLVDERVEGVTVLRYTEQPPADIVNGLKGIDGSIIEEHQAAVVYGFDRHDGNIRTLYRTETGHDLVNFTRAEAGDPLFCHQGGFLLRFRPSDGDEWKRLVAESVLREPGV